MSYCNKKLFLFFISILSFINYISATEKITKSNKTDSDGILFYFDQHKGDSASHVCQNYEEAYFNYELISTSEFITRMTTTVLEELDNGAAVLQGNYMTTESLLEDNGALIPWSNNETKVTISRAKNGQLYNSNSDSMPTVRGVPSFPDYELHINDSWKMRGVEIIDGKDMFYMNDLIEVPFTAYYQYVGNQLDHNKSLCVIDVYYELYQINTNNNLYKTGTFASVQGEITQRLYWDNEKHELDHYEEYFIIELLDIYNNSFLIKSDTIGNVTEYKSQNTDEQVEKIKDLVEEYDLKDVSVTKGEKGLTISIENIQFEPDSDILLQSELDKLQKLSGILQSVSNDLLITGHCANRGTEAARQSLSESRAGAVANFLIENGVRDKMHIFTQGKGATEPIASNDTEAGRAKNRRVEITIMD